MREEEPPRGEARRRPIAAFGGVTQQTASLREGRRLAWLGGLSLDMKLGFRMLVKYPGLTLIGGLAMAFSIWVGAVVFEMVRVTIHPTLPLPDGERIVKIENWDRRESQKESRMLHDFGIWRGTLRSVTDLGVYSDVSRNLVVSGGEARRVNVAEITASAFRIAPARPLLGRVLIESDERPDAPPVLLLGHDVWRTRFASDPKVIGRSVQLDEGFAEIVGVMPGTFKFPVSHDLWVPLRITAADRVPRSGANVTVFGRLAPGAGMGDAQAEVEVIGKRLATDLRKTHEHLRPFVRSYATFFGEPGSSYALMRSFNVFALLLVVLLCSNVALLMFARAATRETEIVVRSAIGASRKRIVAQLFAEALVLGGVAAAVGLAAVGITLRLWGREFFELQEGVVPFWVDPKLSLPTILYAVVLTLVAAAIAGIIPGLKVTRGIGARLKQGTSGSGLRFGGIWTAVIIAQVAVTVAVPAAIFVEQSELRRIERYDGGFKSEQYLALRLEMPSEGDGVDTTARYVAAVSALRQRLLSEPGVSGVTFASHLPRLGHPESGIELSDQSGAAVAVTKRVDIAHVDPSYLDVLDAPVRAGRGFREGDGADGAPVVIVDQGFVDQVLGGRNALGRQLRLTPTGGAPVGEERPWFEIVGVVKDLGMSAVWEREPAAGVYFPIRLDRGPLQMIVHARAGDPLALAPRIRTLSMAVDPTLQLAEIQRLDEVADPILWILRLWLRITAALTGIAVLLSLAGIYAVLSFAVARRTREIGVRVALGASHRGVITAIFRRPLTQVAGGVAVGTLLVGVLVTLLAAPPDSGRADTSVVVSALRVVMLVAYAATMFGVCMLACIVPTRRALRVQPTVALRAE
jgi:predicted permease